MRWRGLILGALALLLLLPGCRRTDPMAQVQEGPTLEVAIQFPYVSATKGKELAATDLENKIHSLAIWVFRSSDEHPPVGEPLFLTDEADFPPEGGIGRYKFEVDWNFVNTHPDVDVFVLANAASIGCTLGAASTYDEVSAASFGYVSDEDDCFGTHTYTTTVDPEKGLPMSGMKTHVKVYGSAPQMKVDPITLVRAISRLRMVLCRTATDDIAQEDEVSVSGITFYKEQIPLREYVFTEGTTGVIPSYTPADFSFSGPAEINRNPVPEDLIYVNQDPDAYQQMLDQACTAGTLTDLGYVYLRESDKRIFGRVDYKINGKDRSREFAATSTTDFARNHTWTLFAYFMSGRNLQVSLVSSPWTKGDYHVDFSGQAVNVTRKFRMDERTCEIPKNEDGSIKYSEDGYIDVKLIPGTSAKGTLTITTPVGGTLMITPLGAAPLFSVTQQATIAPDKRGGEITIEITNNPDTDVDISELPASETTLSLSFSVSVLGREVNVDSEAIDSDYKYRFHL